MDVEKTLRELRERVRAQIRSQSAVGIAHPAEAASSRPDVAAIESLKANLSVVERSWNRLPPITSYRRGWLSRFEIWLKRRLKRVTHWFTWEQVNFNSATSNSLRDVLTLLSLHEQLLNGLQEQLDRIAAVATGIQSESPALRVNGYLNGKGSHEEQSADHEPTVTVSEDERTAASAGQCKDIDLEISNLAARIEELREMKLRLEGLS